MSKLQQRHNELLTLNSIGLGTQPQARSSSAQSPPPERRETSHTILKPQRQPSHRWTAAGSGRHRPRQHLHGTVFEEWAKFFTKKAHSKEKESPTSRSTASTSSSHCHPLPLDAVTRQHPTGGGSDKSYSGAKEEGRPAQKRTEI